MSNIQSTHHTTSPDKSEKKRSRLIANLRECFIGLSRMAVCNADDRRRPCRVSAVAPSQTEGRTIAISSTCNTWTVTGLPIILGPNSYNMLQGGANVLVERSVPNILGGIR